MKRKCIHFGQIITNKRCIKDVLLECDTTIQMLLIGYLNNPNEKKSIDYLVSEISWIQRFIYRGKAGLKKLSEKEYRLYLFESTTPEVNEFMDKQQLYVLRKYNRIVDFIVHMLAVENELYLPIEFEYVIRYVESHKTLVDKPIYDDKNSLFPNNLEDFNLKYEYESN